MRTLAIDSATEACSVAHFDDDTMIAGEWRMLGRGHAELLVPMIAALPGKGRAERIVVSLGPGSFTGVRVGLAAARALALAWGADIAGFPTLDLVAAMAREKGGRVPVTVAMTGGHGEWFVQGYDKDGTLTHPLASLPPAIAVEVQTQLVAGSQAEALVNARGFGEALALWPDARSFPLLPDTALIGEIHPLYGRPPDARLPGGAR
ncbi:MAG: tRNA (adenosine(37)-N6)-threonylcarbamoyltransferase complex dimerization subunit type 1 TsaB [Novosphingobium sp.]